MGFTVLIVDDHADFRAFARRLLEEGGMEVVGEAADAASAMTAAAELQPRLVLLDIRLPDDDGIQVARRLTQAGHGPAVVLVSSRVDSGYGSRITQSGARGFIPKDELSVARLRALVETPA